MNSLLDITGELRAAHTPWYLDARFPRACAIVSHAHSDHLGRHARVIATPVTCALMAHRLTEPGEPVAPEPLGGPIADAVDRVSTECIALNYGEVFRDGDTRIELFPAGHVLGSAMPRITTAHGRLLYTGDFRFGDAGLTVEACRPPDDGADVVLMECTYGLSRYRFPPRRQVIEQLCVALAGAMAEGKQPVCLCYSLGKAQEIARLLIDQGFAVSMHRAAYDITGIYQDNGVRVGPVQPCEAARIAGTVLIAPPHIRNSRLITAIANPWIAIVSGWAMDSSCRYRYQADAAFPFSDHADFDELNAFVDAMRQRGTRQFLLTHGFVKEFARHLRGRDIPASPARPPAQMSLFDD